MACKGFNFSNYFTLTSQEFIQFSGEVRRSHDQSHRRKALQLTFFEELHSVNAMCKETEDPDIAASD